MELNEVRDIVQSNYSIDVESLEKVKNVYRIKTRDKEYCLKLIKYTFPHFNFIINVIKHLQNNGFQKIPELIKNNKGSDYISINNCNAYLTPWVDARECNYDNPLDIRLAAEKLAELHIKGQGFNVTEDMQPRIGWFKWIQTFKTRKDEILDFKDRIDKKESLTEFDALYLDHIEEELERCDRAIENLTISDYLEKMKEEIEKRGLCHHDYAHHNVLIDKNGEVNIIDFDYTILDTHLHDLASLLIRRMKNGKWDIGSAKEIIDIYGNTFKVEVNDIPIMAAFMEFPQDFWQVGIQYYWEKQPWGEEFFIKKLTRILEDSEEKQDFVDEFREFRYRR